MDSATTWLLVEHQKAVRWKHWTRVFWGCINHGMCLLTIFFFLTGAFFFGWLSLAALVSNYWKARGVAVFLLLNGLLIGLAGPGKLAYYSMWLAGYLDNRFVHQYLGA